MGSAFVLLSLLALSVQPHRETRTSRKLQRRSPKGRKSARRKPTAVGRGLNKAIQKKAQKLKKDKRESAVRALKRDVASASKVRRPAGPAWVEKNKQARKQKRARVKAEKKALHEELVKKVMAKPKSLARQALNALKLGKLKSSSWNKIHELMPKSPRLFIKRGKQLGLGLDETTKACGFTLAEIEKRLKNLLPNKVLTGSDLEELLTAGKIEFITGINHGQLTYIWLKEMHQVWECKSYVDQYSTKTGKEKSKYKFLRQVFGCVPHGINLHVTGPGKPKTTEIDHVSDARICYHTDPLSAQDIQNYLNDWSAENEKAIKYFTK